MNQTNPDLWIDIAFKYLKYSLQYRNIKPRNNDFWREALRVSELIGIEADDIGEFMDALLRDKIGKDYDRDYAANIAISWCKAHKNGIAKMATLSEQDENAYILNVAAIINVPPDEALAFNRFLLVA